MDEAVARRIFEAAIAEQRCGEVLQCLFDGGTVTVDRSGGIVLMNGDLLAGLVSEGGD